MVRVVFLRGLFPTRAFTMHTLHTLPEERLRYIGGLRARVWEGVGLADADDTVEITP